MKWKSSERQYRLFNTTAQGVALAPALGGEAWLQAELARQEALQRLTDRDFTLDSMVATPARKEMAAFAKGELPSKGAFLETLERMMDPGRDAHAMEVKGDALGIVEAELMAEDMIQIGSLDRHLFNLCVTGRFCEAIRFAPCSGYETLWGSNDWTLDDILNVIDHLARYWILDGLHDAARECHERIFHPTGCDVLDGEFTGSAPRMGGIAGRIDWELKVFEKVDKIYRRDLRTDERNPNEAEDAARCLLVFGTPTAKCTISAPSVALRGYGRPAGVKETDFLRDLGREAVAKRELERLRAEYGGQLETYLEARMDFARRKTTQLRREIDAIRNSRSRACRRAYTRLGITPLARLWLACEAAVAWALPVKLDHKSPLTLAVEGMRKGRSVRRPKPHKNNVRQVRNLFYALRCTTVQDPSHLPDTLRETTLPKGQKVIRGTHSNVVRVQGAITFSEIWAEFEARDTHKGREAGSTGFTREANAFRKAHHRAECDHCRDKLACPVVDGRWRVVERWLLP